MFIPKLDVQVHVQIQNWKLKVLECYDIQMQN